MSDTPRTDELSYISSACGGVRVVTAEHMAEMERELAAVTRERDEARRTAEFWKGNHLAGNAEIDALRAEVERLTSAIRWALGEDEGPPEFEPPEDADKRRYWWRQELMRRAALQEPTP